MFLWQNFNSLVSHSSQLRRKRWRPVLAQWLVHWSRVMSITVSAWMGDRQGRSCAVNLPLHSRCCADMT